MLYPQQTRKKLFGLRYLYFPSRSFNQAEEPINWINMAYQSPEHSTLCNRVKSVAAAGLPTRLQLIELQSSCFHVFASCKWQQWHSLSWWLGTGFKLGKAYARISVQRYPAGAAAPKINKRRLPTDPLTEHQLHFYTWHLFNKRLHCGCMRQ